MRATGKKPPGPIRALVTGGSGAIGAAICGQLARGGAHVVVHANRRRELGGEVAAAIRAQGGSAGAVVFDVTDTDAAQAVLKNVLGDGPIQVLVDKAGSHD